MKKKTCVALIAVLALSTLSGCDGLVRDTQKRWRLTRLQKLKSYHGIVDETFGKKKARTEVYYEKPNFYHLRTLEPSSEKGSVLHFDRDQLLAYSPSAGLAISFKNIRPLSLSETEELVAQEFNYNLANFNYRAGGSGKVANMKTTELIYSSKNENGRISGGNALVDEELAIPLAGMLRFGWGSSFQFAFSEIRTNIPIDRAALKPRLPTNTIQLEWDLASKAFTPEQARKSSNFQFKEPRALPMGLERTRIIRQNGPIPAFTWLYENRPYYLNISVQKDYGILAPALSASARAIAVPGPKRGALFLAPHASIYAFATGGTQYVLVSNLPLEEFMRVADSL